MIIIRIKFFIFKYYILYSFYLLKEDLDEELLLIIQLKNFKIHLFNTNFHFELFFINFLETLIWRYT